MATVSLQFDPASAQVSSTAFPGLTKNAGTNFPVTVLAFDAASAENAFWVFRAVNYGSGNLTVDLDWYADTATSGVVRWAVQIAAITPDGDSQDVETKAFATAQTADDTHLGTTGQRLHRCTVTVSNLDSLAVGDVVWLKVYRDAANGADTMAGDAFLTWVTVSYSDS